MIRTDMSTNPKHTPEIASLVSATVEIRKKFRDQSISVRPETKKHRAKFRPGGDRIVRLVADVADGVRFEIPGASTLVMRQTLDHALQLQSLLNEVEPLAQAIRDSIFDAESECWTVATAYYSALKEMS